MKALPTGASVVAALAIAVAIQWVVPSSAGVGTGASPSGPATELGSLWPPYCVPSQAALERSYDFLPMTWIDFEYGGGGVCCIHARDLRQQRDALAALAGEAD